jgi:hypothetical protein
MVYIVWGAAAYSEFKRTGNSSSVFGGVNGTLGLVQLTSGTGGEPDLWTLTNADGFESKFFASGTASGQLWKISDPAGNVAYVGDATTASTAVTNGYDTGRITKAYDSADRRYTYAYSAAVIGSTKRLASVIVETKSSGSWSSPSGVTEVARVEYSYYESGGSDLAYGDVGNLKLVKVTTPLSESGVTSVAKRYFRYFTGSYSSSNHGQSYLIKHVIDAEGCRRYDLDDADLFAATDSQIKPYARMSFEYDSSKRVEKTYGYGQCGCGGGSTNGVSTISYDNNNLFSDNTSAYDADPTNWKARAVVARPDGTYLTQYVDEVGQGLSRVVTPTDPATSTATQWTTYVTRDSSDAGLDGYVQEISEPNNVTSYNHSAGSFVRSSSVGVVQTFVRIASSDLAGLGGLVTDRKHSRAGTSGSQYLDQTATWTSSTVTKGGISILRPRSSGRKSFFDAATSTGASSNNSEVTVAYVAHSGSASMRPKTVTMTYPAVTAAKNGENATHTVVQYLRTDGTVAFTKSRDDIYTYTQYSNGQLVKRIDDCVLNDTDDFAAGDDPSGDFGISENGNGLGADHDLRLRRAGPTRRDDGARQQHRRRGPDRAEDPLLASGRPEARDARLQRLRQLERHLLRARLVHGLEPVRERRAPGHGRDLLLRDHDGDRLAHRRDPDGSSRRARHRDGVSAPDGGLRRLGPPADGVAHLLRHSLKPARAPRGRTTTRRATPTTPPTG